MPPPRASIRTTTLHAFFGHMQTSQWRKGPSAKREDANIHKEDGVSECSVSADEKPREGGGCVAGVRDEASQKGPNHSQPSQGVLDVGGLGRSVCRRRKVGGSVMEDEGDDAKNDDEVLSAVAAPEGTIVGNYGEAGSASSFRPLKKRRKLRTVVEGEDSVAECAGGSGIEGKTESSNDVESALEPEGLEGLEQSAEQEAMVEVEPVKEDPFIRLGSQVYEAHKTPPIILSGSKTRTVGQGETERLEQERAPGHNGGRPESPQTGGDASRVTPSKTFSDASLEPELNDVPLYLGSSSQQSVGTGGLFVYSQDDPTPIPIPRRSSVPADFHVGGCSTVVKAFGRDPRKSEKATSTVFSLVKSGVVEREVVAECQGQKKLASSDVSAVPEDALSEAKGLEKSGGRLSEHRSSGGEEFLTLQGEQNLSWTNIRELDQAATLENGAISEKPTKKQPVSWFTKTLEPETSLLEPSGPAVLGNLGQISTATGSLFGSSYVTSKTPPCSDFASPKFDPGAIDVAAYLIARPAPKTEAAMEGDMRMRFSAVCRIFDELETLKGSGSGSKKKSVVVLTNLFRILLWHAPTDLVPLVYICLNKIAPDFVSSELGVGESLLLRLVTEVYGRSEKAVKADLEKYEDLGRVAELSRCRMRMLFHPQALTVQSVFSEFKELPEITGQVSQSRKREKIKKLLVAAGGSEPKYLVRFLQGHMRMGVQTATVYQALAYAFVLTRPKSVTMPPAPYSDIRRQGNGAGLSPSTVEQKLVEMEVALRSALCEVSDVEVVIRHLFGGCTSVSLKEKCVVTPGIPIHPMLAKPTKGIQEVLTRFANCAFTCEFKYDGERAQIHRLTDGTVSVFSRSLENLTGKYPDVVEMIARALNPTVSSCILDSEIVAFDTETQKILPFQVLATRKRKGVEATNVAVKVCVYAFDCMEFNGKRLIQLPVIERRKYLYQCAQETTGEFMFAQHAEMNTMEEVDEFLQEALKANCEGLMVKTLEVSASYEPSKRSLNWLKLKKDYLENLTDSVDLVPIGGYWGTGKRSKCFGTYLLACYHPDEGIFQTVCKVGTGFTDEDLRDFHAQLVATQTEMKDERYQCDARLEPDVWFRPTAVWEVRAADLSLSPVHTAALGLKHLERGIGLRFPRFMRIREDKTPERATTSFQIADLYQSQFTVYAGMPTAFSESRAALETDMQMSSSQPADTAGSEEESEALSLRQKA